MALGGGKWIAQNKILPGAYINFISAARATATLSDRGIATIPIVNDWGAIGEVVEVTAADFQRNSMKIFGYDFTDPKMKGLRDFFKNIRLGYIFRLGSGGTRATNTYATARFAGERGNALKVIVAPNVDVSTMFDVTLLLGVNTVDRQTVTTASELVNNDYVTWNGSLTLTPTAGTPLAGGASPVITNANYQTYLDMVEQYSFNAIGCPSSEAAVKGLFAAFTKRMRDEQGVNFQCVAFNPDTNSDFEGVIDVMNPVDTTGGDADWSAVFWSTGVAAGTNVNASAMNRRYDGEFTINTNYTQTQLENAIRGGKFAFHRVGSDVRVLADINSLVTLTAEKGADFQQNQTIRVIDQIGNDIAVLFSTKYLGVVPNDADGRISLWSDIVQHHEQLQTIRAIENFSGDDVTVEQGDNKRSVLVNDRITPVNAMAQLYMTCVVA
jgi:hypothetical protein